jgi:hypothetical protein
VESTLARVGSDDTEAVQPCPYLAVHIHPGRILQMGRCIDRALRALTLYEERGTTYEASLFPGRRSLRRVERLGTSRSNRVRSAGTRSAQSGSF